MEALGINLGYLAIQILCMMVIPLLIAAGIAYWLIQRNALKEANIITTIVVTDDGAMIPNDFLLGATEVDVYQNKNKLVLVPKFE